MTIEITELGFRPSYDVEVNPEYPANGDWGIPELRFGSRSGTDTFRAGQTLTLRVRPVGDGPWVGFFAVLTPDHFVHGLFACPNARHLLVATGTEAYLIDVTQPGAVDELPIGPVIHVWRPSGMDMLLIGSFTNLAAVDEVGLRWVTGRLFLDDLALAEGPGARIYVRGSVHPDHGVPALLTIDPLRGDVIEGPRYSDVVRPHGYPGWRRPGI